MKKVSFNLDNNKTYTTYSNLDYDRCQIDSILYKKCYNRVDHEEWRQMCIELYHYKLNEMIVHKDSIQNTTLNN